MDLINEYLKYMVEVDASDIYFTVACRLLFVLKA